MNQVQLLKQEYKDAKATIQHVKVEFKLFESTWKLFITIFKSFLFCISDQP